MKHLFKQPFFYTSIFSLIALGLIIGNFVFGWTTPTAIPPSSNLPAPINVSSTEQTKTGNLIIGGNLTTGGFKMPTGAGANKVLTTDASGVASWQTAAGGSLWTQTGNDIYYNTGNVGIGTTTPNNLLSVYELIDFNNTDANTKLGYQAGKNIVSGAQYNTFVGYQAGMASSTGSTGDDNIAVGAWAFWSNTTGWFNTAIGNYSLMYNTSGNDNTAIGAYSLQKNTIGEDNTAVGYWALSSNITGNYNIAIGNEALYTATSSVGNTAVGISSLRSNYSTDSITGNYNSAIGYGALRSNTIGSYNSAFGAGALYYNTTGNGSSAMGYNALATATGINGGGNSAMGDNTLYLTTTGIKNSAMGASAMRMNTTGNYNSAMGADALYSNTTASNNTALGFRAGKYITGGSTANATSSNSLYLGYDTRALASGDTNEIVIGYTATGVGSNSVVLGNDSITKTILKGNVGIGTSTPAQKLSVVGTIESTSGGFKFPDGSTQTKSMNSACAFCKTCGGTWPTVSGRLNIVALEWDSYDLLCAAPYARSDNTTPRYLCCK